MPLQDVEDFLRDNLVFYHRAQVRGGRTYLLLSKYDAIPALQLARASLEFGIPVTSLDGRRPQNDSNILFSDGFNVGSELTILLCAHLPDGRWVHKFKDAPISRVWPPQDFGGFFKDRVFDGPPTLVCAIPGQSVKTVSAEASPAGPVDFVYTWVDSSQPKWRVKKAFETEVTGWSSADNSLRYLSRDELRYSVRSVLRNAPWVRNIYIVTDDQTPSWLQENDRVKVIDHKDIFPDPSVLPVFNSHAIESCLHRLPGLSEHFVYFNDDVFLGKNVGVSDFFDRDGRTKIYASQASFIDVTLPHEMRVPTDLAAYNMQRLIERDFGTMPTRKMMHTPHPLRKSVLSEIEKRYPEEMAITRSAKVRSPSDISFPSMFYPYYALATGRASVRSPGETGYSYIDTGKSGSLQAMKRLLSSPPHFFCLNVTSFEDVPVEEQASAMRTLLNGLYPKAAFCEKPRPGLG